MPRVLVGAQTRTLLAALDDGGSRWCHGYELGKRTGLKLGSLYPILIRLAERRLLDVQWEPDPPHGRPARHLYRLTAAGEAHLASLEMKAREQPRASAERREPRGAEG